MNFYDQFLVILHNSTSELDQIGSNLELNNPKLILIPQKSLLCIFYNGKRAADELLEKMFYVSLKLGGFLSQTST